MTKTIDYTADIIDVRDLIERFEELESECHEWADNGDDQDAWDELNQLKDLLEGLKGNGGDKQWRGDWYPVTLIRESYFEEYMDEMVEDCYDVPKNLPSFMTITLDYVALQMDYTSTEIDGVTYLYR